MATPPPLMAGSRVRPESWASCAAAARQAASCSTPEVPGLLFRRLRSMELGRVQRSQWVQALMLGRIWFLPSVGLGLPGEPFFHLQRFFLKGQAACRKAECSVRETGLLKTSRTIGTCYYLLGSQKWKKSSPDFRKLPASCSLHQSSKQQLLGFLQSSLDPREHLLNARHWALPRRMGVVEGVGGFST